MSVIVAAWGARAVRVVMAFSLVARFAIATGGACKWRRRLLTVGRGIGSRHVEVGE
jgi:hypothetical protein